METCKVYFDFDVVNDMITAINGNSISSINAVDFICGNFPDNSYWIERSWRGYSRLCTNLPLFQDEYITIGAGMGAKDIYAQNFLGGRPDDRR